MADVEPVISGHHLLEGIENMQVRLVTWAKWIVITAVTSTVFVTGIYWQFKSEINQNAMSTARLAQSVEQLSATLSSERDDRASAISEIRERVSANSARLDALERKQ